MFAPLAFHLSLSVPWFSCTEPWTKKVARQYPMRESPSSMLVIRVCVECRSFHMGAVRASSVKPTQLERKIKFAHQESTLAGITRLKSILSYGRNSCFRAVVT